MDQNSNNTDHNNREQSYTEMGEQVLNAVMNAVTDGDFSGLSDSITQSIGTVLGDVGSQLNSAASRVQKSRDEAMNRAESYHRADEERMASNKATRAAYVKRPNQTMSGGTATNNRTPKYNSVGRIGGIVSILVGCFLGWWMLILTLGMLLTEPGMIGVNIIFFLLLAGCGYLIGNGISKVKLESTARKYRKIASEKMYCAVDDLARATGTDKKKVVKNLKKMLSKGFFPEGYMDDQETTFMMTKEVYEQYRATLKNMEKTTVEDLAEARVGDTSGLTEAEREELLAMMKDGSETIRKLHELNDEIPGEVISAKLDTMEHLLAAIIDRLREDPSQISKCHKLISFYMPSMLNLVQKYAEFDKISSPDSGTRESMAAIEKSLDSLIMGYQKLLNDTYQESIWDANAEASVLNTMLQQDGLIKDDLQTQTSTGGSN